MSKKLSTIINSTFFLTLILTFSLIFFLIAPASVNAAVYDAENEKANNIRGDIIDFSNLEKFNFSGSSSSYTGNDDFGGSYTILKEGSNYTITLNNFTAKKIILPYDDADSGKPFYQKGKARKTHISIVLIGTNNVTGYGISGGYTKGVTITGSGSLNINAYKEIVAEHFLNMNELTPEEKADPNLKVDPSRYKEETNSYIVPGIVVETDAINNNDPHSGFIFEATGQITINSPYYWGIICNGDIKLKSGSNVSITANPTGKKVAQSGAISADRIIKETGATLKTSGTILESKKDEPIIDNSTKSEPKNTCGPVITGEGIVAGGTYCENPIITVTDDKEIVNIKVNGIGITKYIQNSWTKKTFAIPTYLSDKKTIIATDSDGNKTTFEFTSHNGHISNNGTETNRVAATCTDSGYHEIEYKCLICKKVLRTETIVDEPLGHSFGDWTIDTPVQSKRTCNKCGYVETKNTGIKLANATVSLSQSNYVYDGKSKKPTVTVKYNNKTLVNGKDYSVAYKNNVKTGTATVTISGKAQYLGTIDKKFVIKKANNSIKASNFTKSYSTKAQSFSINAKQVGNAKLTYSSNNKNVKVNSSGKITIAKKFVGKATITITANATSEYNKVTKKITITVNPSKITTFTLSDSSKGKITLKWNKNTAVTGYQIQYSTDKNFKKNVKTITIKKNSTVSTTISKLTKNKTYYVRIRGYKTVSKVNYYSAWSSTKSIKIKK